MAEPFAVAEDVEARWRPLSDAERQIAQILCIDASNMIRERWADVDARIATGSLMEESLQRVVANMVKRAMLVGDAEGLTAQQQTSGPFSVNNQYANPSGNLYFNAADTRLLDGGARRRAFAVDLSANIAPASYPQGY